MIINFVLVQFVPGGPVEQIIAQMEGGGDVFEGISGGGSELVENESGDSVASRGLPQEFLDQLQVEFNFARIVCDAGYTGEPDLRADACNPVPIPGIERFFLMMWDYMRFDFGESYFRSVTVVDLVLEKMPVSITLGLWSTLIAYMVSIPLGIKKAVRDGTSFDTWTSAAIIVGYAIPGFLFAILLIAVLGIVIGLLLSDFTIHLLFGAEFESAGQILEILVVAMLPAFQVYFFRNYLIIIDQKPMMITFSVFGLIIRLACAFVLVSQFGIWGSAISILISESLIAIALWYYIARVQLRVRTAEEFRSRFRDALAALS